MKTISGSKIIFTILFAFVFIPCCITSSFAYTLPVLYRVSRYWRYCSCFFLLVLSLKYWSNARKIVLLGFVILYFVVLYFSTVVNHIALSALNNYSSKALLLFLFFFIAGNHYTEEMVNGAWWVCFVLSTINILSIVLYPEGLYFRDDLFENGQKMGYWFLGNRNLFVDFLYPMLVLSLLLHYINGQGLVKFALSIILSITTVALTGSATTILVILIVLMYYLFCRKGLLKKFANPVLLSTGYAVVSVSVVLLGNSSFFSYFIVNVLKKDLTLSGRVSIWTNVYNHIIKNPIKGYGFRNGDDFIDNSIVMHAHNLFLHIAYSGGIIAFGVLVLLLLICIAKIKRIQSYTILYLLLTFMFFAYLWMEFSEPRIYFPFLFGMISIICNSSGYIRKRIDNLGNVAC